jgi:hypothetical protein
MASIEVGLHEAELDNGMLHEVQAQVGRERGENEKEREASNQGR